MPKKILIGVTAWLLLAAASSSFGQQPTPQPSNPPDITPNAVLERLLQASKNKDLSQPQTTTITELKGFPGPAIVCVTSPCPVRLYWDLSLSRYWDIPANAIIHQVPGSDPKNDPVKLYVPSSTPLVTGTTLSADAAVIQKAFIDSGGNIPFEGPGVGAGRPGPRSASCGGWVAGCLMGSGASCIAGYLCAK
jgi:hypothetical protein